MSFTETNVNQQRDDVENKIANADQLVESPIEPDEGLIGEENIKVGYSAEYILKNVEGNVSFSISDKKLATIEPKRGTNMCVVKANENNKLGTIILTAEFDEITYTKEIKIVPLWQVN